MEETLNPADSGARIVIVGAGHAGGSAAAFLRQYGHAGPVTLIGAEPVAPYQRPPLSKAYLKGETDVSALKLKPDAFYPQKDIDLRLDTRVARIDREARAVLLEDGEAVPYDVLILATGSKNRKLEIAPDGMTGLHELRSLADADGLRAALGPGHRLLIVGGGYIGLEAAASARALGAEAVVVERESRVLARVASPELSAFFEEYHRAHGVQVVTGAGLDALEAGPDGRVAAGVLSGGERVPCDLALVGVGALAEDALARRAGLACDGGVVVDHFARTSDPAIYAIGDATFRPLPLYEDRSFRLESVPNALELARQAAAAITGRPQPKPEVPWFWSDQYDLKLQIAGLPFEADATVRRGAPGKDGFAIFHLCGPHVRAVEAVNAPADFMGGRLLIGSRAEVKAERLADPDVPIREVAA